MGNKQIDCEQAQHGLNLETKADLASLSSSALVLVTPGQASAIAHLTGMVRSSGLQ